MMNRLEIMRCHDVEELKFQSRELADEIKFRKAMAEKEFNDKTYLQAADDLRRLAELVSNLGWCEERIRNLERSLRL